MPFQLVHTPIQPDLRSAGQDILEGIESGSIQGLAVVVVTKGQHFFVDVFGSLIRTPHEARGLVAELDDCLRDIGRRRRSANTTI